MSYVVLEQFQDRLTFRKRSRLITFIVWRTRNTWNFHRGLYDGRILHGLPVRDSWVLPRSWLAPFQTLFDPPSYHHHHHSLLEKPGARGIRSQTNGFPREQHGLLRLNRVSVLWFKQTALLWGRDEWHETEELSRRYLEFSDQEQRERKRELRGELEKTHGLRAWAVDHGQLVR